MIEGRTFVVFSDDWGRHPSSSQHLFRRLARANRVLWVNTIGTRVPTLSFADLRRAGGKLRRWAADGRKTQNGGTSTQPGSAREPVAVLDPFMTPFDHWRAFRTLNTRLLLGALQRELPCAGDTLRPFLVTTIPNAAGIVGKLGEGASLYYCVDEFAEWPGSDRESMLTMERELLSRVDVVVATSEALVASKSRLHPSVHLLRHGVDWESFHEGRGSPPEALASLPRPRFGFTGLLDGRLDVALVKGLAERFAEASFVFVGPRQLARGPLDELRNVHFLPAVAYDDVPAVLAALDVAILPYQKNALTQNINPLKLREFLASGIPVVATALPEVLRFSDWLLAPKGLEGWGDALHRALSEGRSRSLARSESMRREGWDERAVEFGRFCLEAEKVHREKG